MSANLYLYKDKSGIRYKIQFRLNGCQKTRRLKRGTTKQQAILLLHRYDKAIADYAITDSFIDPLKYKDTNQMTIQDFGEWFLQNKTTSNKGKLISNNMIKAYQDSIRVLMNCLGNIKILEIANKLNVLDMYFHQNYSPSSRSIHVRQLRSMWNLGIKKSIVKHNPFSDLELLKDKPLPNYYTPRELNDLFFHLQSPQLVIAYMFLRYGAMRRDELIKIEKKDINFEIGYIKIKENTKTGERFIPLHPALRMFLLIIYIHLPDQGLVITVTGGHISRFFKRAQVKAGLKRKGSVHLFRHSAGTNIDDIEIAQKILGHKSKSTTDIYRHLDIKRIGERYFDQKI